MSWRGSVGFAVLSVVAVGTLASATAQRSRADVSRPSHRVAEDTNQLRIIISIRDRRLWVVDSTNDTLRSASVGVGTDATLHSGDRSWKFSTPRGVTSVVAKEVNPVWIPPDWHYVEIARANGWSVQRLATDGPVKLRDGALLRVRGEEIGVVGPDSILRVLPADEEIVFDGTLFVPPFGTRNRRVEGVLGPFRLLLANGVGLHGTPFKESIGRASTHGCLRLLDEDITWLYEHVPVGTRVVLY